MGLLSLLAAVLCLGIIVKKIPKNRFDRGLLLQCFTQRLAKALFTHGSLLLENVKFMKTTSGINESAAQFLSLSGPYSNVKSMRSEFFLILHVERDDP